MAGARQSRYILPFAAACAVVRLFALRGTGRRFIHRPFRRKIVAQRRKRDLLLCAADTAASEGAAGGGARRFQIDFLRHKAVSRGRDRAGFFQFFAAIRAVGAAAFAGFGAGRRRDHVIDFLMIGARDRRHIAALAAAGTIMRLFALRGTGGRFVHHPGRIKLMPRLQVTVAEPFDVQVASEITAVCT